MILPHYADWSVNCGLPLGFIENSTDLFGLPLGFIENSTDLFVNTGLISFITISKRNLSHIIVT